MTAEQQRHDINDKAWEKITYSCYKLQRIYCICPLNI